jgi:hypothetical protein
VRPRFETRDRKFQDVVCQLVEVLVGKRLALTDDQHPEMPVVETLSEDAPSSEPHLLLRSSGAEKLPANGVESLV